MFKYEPKNEYEVQDKLENLFVGNNMDKGLDYDREAGKFKFSGKEYIPDFIIPKYDLCIEVKFIKDVSRKSKMIEEINADITAYKKEYKNILFVIYDIGIIRDESEAKRDIEKNRRSTRNNSKALKRNKSDMEIKEFNYNIRLQYSDFIRKYNKSRCLSSLNIQTFFKREKDIPNIRKRIF